MPWWQGRGPFGTKRTRKNGKEIKGFVRDLVLLEKKPVRGLLVVEWVVMAYLALTLLLILFLYTKLPEANLLLMGACACLP